MDQPRIFVQIDSYRDPELVPTIRDCIAKAKYPDQLTFGICWQRDETESLQEFANDPRVKVVEIHWTESKGACWARSHIQKFWDGEEYLLQLDSHHRFLPNWDVILIDMYNGLKAQGVKKPLLTAYLPDYKPAIDPEGRTMDLWQICYDRFQPEGPVFFKPCGVKNWQLMPGPFPARGLSGHFVFTEGNWCKEVPYDSELYFHGEEISMAVRSYTHGYDLFHPNKLVVWHFYSRETDKKHWSDHKNWGDLNASSYKRVRVLLGVDDEDPNQIDFKACGLGNVRTVHDFERYAGVVFKTRRFHKEVMEFKLAPITYNNEEDFQKNLLREFKHCINIHRSELAETDYDFWCVVFKDKQDRDLRRIDANTEEIKSIMSNTTGGAFVLIWRSFECQEQPYKWVVWPHSVSKDWNTKQLEGVL